MGERWPPYPTGGRKTRKLEKRAHVEKEARGTRREKRKRGSRGAFLRDVAFAGHHAYVTLREGHVRAYNTIRGVIPPSPLSDTSSTSTSPSPSSPLSWTLFLVPHPLSFRSLYSTQRHIFVPLKKYACTRIWFIMKYYKAVLFKNIFYLFITLVYFIKFYKKILVITIQT